MKSLLQFALMISLVVVGKLNREPSVPATVIKADVSVLATPVRNASLQHRRIAMPAQKQGSGSRFWQVAAPVSVNSYQ